MQDKIPLIGLGTYQLLGKECANIIAQALEIGYRHIDTAIVYENQKDIGNAVAKINREELFLTSKFFLGGGETKELCHQCLKELKTEYLDLFLIHWPDRNYPMKKIVKEMEELKNEGKVRFIGVSNFTEHHLQDLYDAGCKPTFNQVEFHPYLNQKELLSFARNHGTELIAYRPFGKGKLIQDEPLFSQLAEKYQKTPAQIILHWFLQKKIPVIPKASSKKHLEENFFVTDFQLLANEMTQIDELNKNFRYCLPKRNEFEY